MMRNAVPMRWIEQAEARAVITASLFQLPERRDLRGVLRDWARQVLPRLAAWSAAWESTGCPTLRAQPALVRARPSFGNCRRPAGDY